MIKATQKDDELLKSIETAKEDTQGFYLWWLGQSGFLIQWQGRHILLDPYLSDSLTTKYQETDKQHIRMTELVVDPTRLDFIDIVTSSHNHTDHLDAETLRPLIATNPEIKMVVPRANIPFVADRLQCEPEWLIGLNEKESQDLGNGITIHGIPAAHNELLRDDSGNCRFMGYVVSFGDYNIYHSGDTLWRDEIIRVLEDFDIDIALLPINGNRPERRVAGNLNAQEAVDMAQAIGANLVIPCHYHMFTFNTVDPDNFVEIAEKSGQDYKVMLSGEGIHYRGSGKSE